MILFSRRIPGPVAFFPILFLCSLSVKAETNIKQLPGVVDAPPPAMTSQGTSPSSSISTMSSSTVTAYRNILASNSSSLSDTEAVLDRQIRLLNQIPEAQLNEHAEPAITILKTIYDYDGPSFSHLRTLLGRANERAMLNPTTKGVLATLLSDRWDTFKLCGNLWLAAIRSQNSDIRLRARQRLIEFIQPAHIPVLIATLKVPGPNVLAYEILQEVTGQAFDPNIHTWQAWWKASHGQVDLVGHLLTIMRIQPADMHVQGLDMAKFWYLPDGVSNSLASYAKHSEKERKMITDWNEWANTDVKKYVDACYAIKPDLARLIHQPDNRITRLLEKLVPDEGLGDYASIVLAWRGSQTSLPIIQNAYQTHPTVGRALGRASLGEKEALQDLLKHISHHPSPLTFGIMDQNARSLIPPLHSLGVLPAEQAFEFLTHQSFGLANVTTHREKKHALKKTQQWMNQYFPDLTWDPALGYYKLPKSTK